MEKRIEAAGLARLYRYRKNWLGDFLDELRRRMMWISHQRHFPRSVRDRACLLAFRLRAVVGATASDVFETDILELIFNATTLDDLAVNDTSGPATTLSFALHTGDPGEAGDQSTSEAAYGSYARVAVNRNSGGFTVASGSVSPVANVSFPTSSGAGSTITHFSVGTGVANYMICSGTVTPNIPVGAAGVTPILTTATAITCN